MANSIIMPKTGMAMEEGVILEWRVKAGDKVQKGDVVAEIETDKSTMELESDYDGVVLAILGKAGETVPVTQVIAWIGQPGEKVPETAQASAPAQPVPGASPSAPAASSQAASAGTAGTSAGTAASAAVSRDGKIKATPAARKAAADAGVSLENISPSGKSGEIRLADVAAGGASGAGGTDAGVSATPLARRMAADQGISLAAVAGSGHGGKIFSADLSNVANVATIGPGVSGAARPDSRVPLTKIQQITGRRMLESHQSIPVVTENIRPDVTAMLEMRKNLNDKAGAGVTINDFILLAAVKALLANPRMNSVLDGTDLIYRGEINLGMAVATDRGLLVPVIRGAQNYSLLQLSARAAELAAKAREGKLAPDEMSGGTFSVSNVGMYGITAFTPIINPPEAGILGVCAVEDQLRLDGEKVVNRKVMGLSLTYDHRIVDGAEASVFLRTLKELLETPVLILA